MKMKLLRLPFIVLILVNSCTGISNREIEIREDEDAMLPVKLLSEDNYTAIEELNLLQGIWIAEDFLKSFDQSLSSVKSKNVFDPDFPVGLRINPRELKHGTLNIGYSGLHDHLLRPEVSTFIIHNTDTIKSHGYFKIGLNEDDTIRKFKTSNIYHFSENNSYITWDLSEDTVIFLEREANDLLPYKKIKYKRISTEFEANNLYPNPLYFYTRNRALTGTYTLKDSLDNVLSMNLEIRDNGKISGYSDWENRSIYYSTDIYCGAPEFSWDFVMLCIYDSTYFPECDGFIYNRVDKNTIQFHKSKWTENVKNRDLMTQELGKMKYRLIKK